MALMNLRLAVAYVEGNVRHEVTPGGTLFVPEFPANLEWWVRVSYDRTAEDEKLECLAEVVDKNGSILARSWVGVLVLHRHTVGTDIPLTDFQVSGPGRFTVRATVNGKPLPGQTVTVDKLAAG
jgi:hypothetical protein